jgi:hypothetical protein
MADYDDDDKDEGSVPRSQIRALEKKAQAADEALKRAEAAERRLAFAEAGIDLKDPKMAYFVKGYDGEVEAEKIRAAAEEAGFLAQPQPTDEQRDVLAGQQRIAAVASGAAPASPGDLARGMQEMQAAYNEHGTEAAMEVARRYGVMFAE